MHNRNKAVEKTIAQLIFGAASFGLGMASLVLGDQLVSSWTLPGDGAFLFVSSIALILSGIAATVSYTYALGSIAATVTYAIFAATFVPSIVAQPKIYASWGNVFYQLAPAAGALAAYAAIDRDPERKTTLRHAATVTFGLCSASFAIEQLEFFSRTSSLVPAWVWPGGAFWTAVTTIALSLAAIALVTGYRAQLAARLVAAMMLAFVPLIWIPRLFADPNSHGNWSEGLETLVIAGAAWIVGATGSSRPRPPRATPASLIGRDAVS